MGKRILLALAASLMTAAISGCGEKGKAVSEVTWEQLCEANRPAAILSRVDSYKVDSKGSDGSGDCWYISKEDGEIIWTNVLDDSTEDYRDGAIYYHSNDGDSPIVWFVTPGTDPLELAAGGYELGIEDAQLQGEIRLYKGQYLAELKKVHDEFGAEMTAQAAYDAETLLLQRVNITEKLGFHKSESQTEFTYGDGISFDQQSYKAISGADNALNIKVHLPDGSFTDYRISKDADIVTRTKHELPCWSICIDQECTASIDDLGWVTDENADLYLFEGEAAPASPALSRVLERSSFDYIFKENFNSYNQSFMFYDGDENWLGAAEFAWIGGSGSEMEYYAEKTDEEGKVVFSAMAADGVWYEWSETNGYMVDFYRDNTYPQQLMADYSLQIDEQHLKNGMELSEYQVWTVTHTEQNDDGTKTEYVYCIADQYDYIDCVYVRSYDADGRLVFEDIVLIYGNSGTNMQRDVKSEIEDPGDFEVVEVKVEASSVSRSCLVRKDADIRWQGKPLYKDRQCSDAVGSLDWVNGKTAVIYAK